MATNASIAITDMVNLQADTYSILAEKLRPYLVAAIRPETSHQSAALEHVKAWDLKYAADSTAALIFETWYKFLVENVLAHKLGKELFYEYTFRFNLLRTTPFIVKLMTDPNNAWFNDPDTPHARTRDDIIRRSFGEALDWLGQRCGNNLKGWTWGRLHTVTFTHMPLGFSHIAPLEYLFNSSELGIPGAQFTVNSEFWLWENPYKVILGPSQRMIVDLGDWDHVLAVNPPGQSGHLFNPHREDQIPLWLNKQYHPLLFTRAAVEKNIEATLTLTPQ